MTVATRRNGHQALTPTQMPPVVLRDSGGVPAWAVVILDALCGANVIRPHHLDGLTTAELTDLAAFVIRGRATPGTPDVPAQIAELRRAAEREGESHAAA